jgi:hypothetical protein
MTFDPRTSDLAGIPEATLRKWLLDAQTALHDLSIGGKPQSVSYGQGDGSKAITFTPATIGVLNAHIAALKAQLGIHGRSRHAITPLFGGGPNGGGRGHGFL